MASFWFLQHSKAGLFPNGSAPPVDGSTLQMEGTRGKIASREISVEIASQKKTMKEYFRLYRLLFGAVLFCVIGCSSGIRHA